MSPVYVGLSEACINLSQAATYLALAPRSNRSYLDGDAAAAHIIKNGLESPTHHIQDQNVPGAEELGRGEGYEYPHDSPEQLSGQRLLPDGVNRSFYEPSDRGHEAEMGERLKAARDRRSK